MSTITIPDSWPTITQQFNNCAENSPDQIAFTQFQPKEIRMTYAELSQHVRNVASWLVKKGLKKGDRAVLIGKNSPCWGVAYLAILQAAGVVVPLDIQLDNDTANHLMDFTEARFLFVDEDRYKSLGQRNTGIKHKVCLSEGNSKNFILDLQAAPNVKFEHVDSEELAAILFTSGTTGREKGAMLTHANLMSDTLLARDSDYLALNPNEVWYALLPLHHSYCMTAVFLEGITRANEIIFASGLVTEHLMKDLERGKVTIFMGIPLLYNKLLKGIMKNVRAKGLAVYLLIKLLMQVSGFFQFVFKINIGKKIFGNLLLKKSNLYNLHYLISGGGPLAPKVVRHYRQLGLQFVQGYGMTETSPISTLNPAHSFKINSVGKVLPCIEMSTVDEDENGVGEIVVKGPICCQGYWKNSEATKELFDDQGWLHTGDLGYLDNQNYLYLTGRCKNLIVTEGGKNVFPEEIEDYFQLADGIEHIMIRQYPRRGSTHNEGIEAVIVPNEEHFSELRNSDDEAINAEILDIVRTINRKLQPYKRIEQIRILKESLPMTSTRKIKRVEVNRIWPPSSQNAIRV